MPNKVAQSTLNASTIDILNVIRQNATYEYQSQVPSVTTYDDVRRVGDVLYGAPALANQFINSLVNRIALVAAKGAVFNNPYSRLKKGYLEFGETVEEIFVNIARVVDYSAEKAESRELKRTLPDVRSAFHVINWRVMYPVTIQDEDLKKAFLSMDGVTDLIARIVDQVYTAAEYDEFLLFKYMLIKAVSAGKFAPIYVNTSDIKNAAVAFRGTSNLLPFMSGNYNEAGVKTATPKSRQVIFMDAMYNAQFDVNVLASAFNMEKADFMGALYLIDDWTSFDNDRFEEIRAASDGLESVTSDELTAMANVIAVTADEDWFQVYDNQNKFTETYVASGLYWNYFYHTWKTVSHSPFANAVVFSSASSSDPETVVYSISGIDKDDDTMVINFEQTTPGNFEFVQTPELIAKLIAVQKYGSVLIPVNASTPATIDVSVKTKSGSLYTATVTLATAAAGDTVTFSPPSPSDNNRVGSAIVGSASCG